MSSITIFGISLALASLAIFTYAVRGHTRSIKGLNQLAGNTHPIDLAAFQKLIDPEDQKFLRKNLPKAVYQRIQRQRNLVCVSYVRCAAHNAAVLIRIGESARASPDPQIRASGKRLVREALRLRGLSVAVLPQLYCSVLFPELTISVGSISAKYQKLVETVANLSRLEDPASTSRVVTAL